MPDYGHLGKYLFNTHLRGTSLIGSGNETKEPLAQLVVLYFQVVHN